MNSFEKPLSILGVAVFIVAAIGIAVFTLFAYYRHVPLAHSVLGYMSGSDSQSLSAPYSPSDTGPLVLAQETKPSADATGCGCPFCCPAS